MKLSLNFPRPRWRGRYPREGGNDQTPANMPAVIPSQLNGAHFAPPVEMDSEVQHLIYEVMRYENSIIDGNRYRGIIAGNVAFTNNHSWVDSKGIKFADHINEKDLDKPNPSLMDGIVCAGGVYDLLEREDGHLWAVPGYSGIDVNKRPFPSVEVIFSRGWIIHATNNTNNPSYFSQGSDSGMDYYGPVILPYFLRVDTPYTKSMFQPWDSLVNPDPLQIYE